MNVLRSNGLKDQRAHSIRRIATALLLCSAMTVSAQKYLGGDISMLPEYEKAKATYLTQDGAPISNVLDFLKEKGWNSMRVRLFVDPSKASQAHKNQGVRQDLEFVKALGKRIKDAGLYFMLDFHYSDTWTDPGQHSTPASWSSSDPDQLAKYLYEYTKTVLQQLKAAGATPDFIQTGNEITYGMLWPTGHCYPNGADNNGGTFANFAKYLKAGIKACREECPQAKIVIQSEMSRDTNVKNFYNTLNNYTTDYDIIGLSYYPHYHGTLQTLASLLTYLQQHYPSKKIEIVETGYYHKWYPTDAKYNLTSDYPATNEGQRKLTADLVALLNTYSSVDGLYWWFPEANEYGVKWENAVTPSGWYNASLWDNETGRCMPAINEMRNFLNDENAIEIPYQPATTTGNGLYNINGVRIPENTVPQHGIYIRNGKKIIY